MERSESFSPGYCDYLVEGFAGKKTVLLRILALVLGIGLLVLLFELLSFIPQVFAVWFVVIVALEVIFFRATKCEFEYTVAMGEMTVEAIYGKRWRKKIFVVRVADADRIFPVENHKDSRILCLNPTKIIFASPKKSEYLYCLYTKNDGGKNSATALVFSSCKKLNDSLKFYNRSCFTEK
jgi:hypothetical protein